MQKKIFHLSHIDLDGYSCQLVMSYSNYDMDFYNANYGAEVSERLQEIILELKACALKEATILVTDLNLSAEESKWIDNEVAKLNANGCSITLQLLDHHGSGKESADRYDWYYLDTSRSATKITFDYAKEHFGLKEPSWMNHYVNVVNAVDLWKQEEVENFELGKVCMRLISEAKELNRVMFAKADNAYKLFLLDRATTFLSLANPPIELDDSIHMLKKEYFMEGENNTLDNLATRHIVNLLSEQKSKMTIYYKGYRGFLSYALGNTSIIGNGFLVANPEYDFIVDVSSRGTLSLRANNQVNVATISKEWCGGGGHPNAAGGRINGFKEQFRYGIVKEQIEKIINEKESVAGELSYKAQ